VIVKSEPSKYEKSWDIMMRHRIGCVGNLTGETKGKIESNKKQVGNLSKNKCSTRPKTQQKKLDRYIHNSGRIAGVQKRAHVWRGHDHFLLFFSCSVVDIQSNLLARDGKT